MVFFSDPTLFSRTQADSALITNPYFIRIQFVHYQKI